MCNATSEFEKLKEELGLHEHVGWTPRRRTKGLAKRSATPIVSIPKRKPADDEAGVALKRPRAATSVGAGACAICEDTAASLELDQTPDVDISKMVFYEMISSPPFRIVVQESPSKKYAAYVHRHLLQAESDYFRMLLRFPDTDCPTNTATLSETGVDTIVAFKHFLTFLYLRAYPDCAQTRKPKPAPHPLDHVRVYIFSERLLAKDFRQFALKSLTTALSTSGYKLKSHGPSTPGKINETALKVDEILEMVRLAYNYTGAQSPLRKLLAKFCGSCFGQLKSRGEFTTLLRGNDEFWNDISAQLGNGGAVRLNEWESLL